MFYKYIFVTGRITPVIHPEAFTTTRAFDVQPSIHNASTLHKVIFQYGREACHISKLLFKILTFSLMTSSLQRSQGTIRAGQIIS